MTIIGKKGAVVRPSMSLVGETGKYPVIGASAAFAAGSIPICRVTLPPEFVGSFDFEASDKLYTVNVGEGSGKQSPIFTGYISGVHGVGTPESFNFGVDLIHPARDLDEMRISAPSLHTSGMTDFSYFMRMGGSTGGNGSNIRARVNFSSGGGPVGQQITNAIIKVLQTSISKNIGVVGKVRMKSESFGPAIALLKKLKFKGGALSGPFVGKLDNSIGQFINRHMTNSISGMQSIWDTMSTLFAAFGLTIICDNLGDITVLPDYAGFKPAASNLLDSDWISEFNGSAAVNRNIKDVVVLNRQIAGKSSKGGAPGTVGQWPTKDPGGSSRGATLAVSMPQWLQPVSAGLAPTQPALDEYAHMIFITQRNAGRNFIVSGPLAPLALPGTTSQFAPFSKAVAKSGGTIAALNVLYQGYIYRVTHTIDAGSKDVKTDFYFKNVSDSRGESISSHPLYGKADPPELQ